MTDRAAPAPQAGADITEAELQRIYDRVQAEIAKYGLPTEDEIRRKIEALNRTAPHQES